MSKENESMPTGVEYGLSGGPGGLPILDLLPNRPDRMAVIIQTNIPDDDASAAIRLAASGGSGNVVDDAMGEVLLIRYWYASELIRVVGREVDGSGVHATLVDVEGRVWQLPGIDLIFQFWQLVASFGPGVWDPPIRLKIGAAKRPGRDPWPVLRYLGRGEGKANGGRG
jgi:hypothetical protein